MAKQAKKVSNKKTVRKNTATPAVKKAVIIAKPVVVKNDSIPTSKKSSRGVCGHRFSIYIYWLIILFFICATFYILGRGQEILKRDSVAAVSPTVTVAGDVTLPAAQLADVANEYVVMGKAKLLSGDMSGAIHDLSLAIEAVETFSDAYVYRGEAYMQLSDYPNALADFSRAIELSDNVIAYYDRGILNMRLENYDAALADLDAALVQYHKTPTSVLSAHDIYARRATLHLWAKNWDAAVEDYNKAISLDNTEYEDYAGRAEAFTGAGDYMAAIADYLSAVRVVSEVIQTTASDSEREVQSRAALAYFEKSAAIRVQINDLSGALSDLESARTIAMALDDSDQVARLNNLIESMSE